MSIDAEEEGTSPTDIGFVDRREAYKESPHQYLAGLWRESNLIQCRKENMEGLKICPFCCKQLQKLAIKCPHCTSDLGIRCPRCFFVGNTIEQSAGGCLVPALLTVFLLGGAFVFGVLLEYQLWPSLLVVVWLVSLPVYAVITNKTEHRCAHCGCIMYVTHL